VLGDHLGSGPVVQRQAIAVRRRADAALIDDFAGQVEGVRVGDDHVGAPQQLHALQ
jgi:hypothetical protein